MPEVIEALELYVLLVEAEKEKGDDEKERHWPRGELRMIDEYDIQILKEWLKLARTEGTDRIKIVGGNEPNTYKVTILPPRSVQPHRATRNNRCSVA